MAFNHNLFPFKRKFTHFNGGECPRSVHDLMGRHDYHHEMDRIEIVKNVGDPDDDLWQVRDANGGYFTVYGHDCSPRPDAPETNVEAITRLMENGSTAFVQLFVMEGARKYAEMILSDEPKTREQMADHFISPDLLIDTAKEVQAFLDHHYNKHSKGA